MASVFLGDLDDFITPSQACVNPLFTNNKQEDGKTTGAAQISLEPEMTIIPEAESSVRPDLIRTGQEEKATVSLDDCLACSGCVTSAEAVLISEHSYKEVAETLSAHTYARSAVTISPQSRASIAAHFDLPAIVTHRKLVTLFRQLGADMVIDSTSCGDFALLESREEFVHRYRNQGSVEWKRPPSSVAHSSNKTEYIEPATDKNPIQDPMQALPMLASACPGWVCYAEKSQPNALPFIDTTKSPQQIAGALMKHLLTKEHGLKPSDVYHVAIMPCFDKKLEASRKDFLDEESNSKDVDCVLATNEILDLLSWLQIDFNTLEQAELKPEEMQLSGVSTDGQHVVGSSVNSGSGGQLEHIFRYAAKELYNVDVEGPLEYKQGRNPDFQEVTLTVDGEEKLKFALAYGFRNIQSIMTKIRRKRCPYQYVEIMACPSGCLNGGGQIKPEKSLQAAQLLESVQQKFRELQERAPSDNPACHYVYPTHLGSRPFSPEAQALLHTRYHAVPKMEQANPLGIKW